MDAKSEKNSRICVFLSPFTTFGFPYQKFQLSTLCLFMLIFSMSFLPSGTKVDNTERRTQTVCILKLAKKVST